MNKISSKEIYEIFEKEFSCIANKFVTVSFPVTEVPKDNNIKTVGVYIFYINDRIWKVGKSFSNVLKRSFQHFQDDTGSNIGKGMKQYLSDRKMNLMLFLLNNASEIYWLLSLECYFELTFREMDILEVPSGRIG